MKFPFPIALAISGLTFLSWVGFFYLAMTLVAILAIGAIMYFSSLSTPRDLGTQKGDAKLALEAPVYNKTMTAPAPRATTHTTAPRATVPVPKTLYQAPVKTSEVEKAKAGIEASKDEMMDALVKALHEKAGIPVLAAQAALALKGPEDHKRSTQDWEIRAYIACETFNKPAPKPEAAKGLYKAVLTPSVQKDLCDNPEAALVLLYKAGTNKYPEEYAAAFAQAYHMVAQGVLGLQTKPVDATAEWIDDLSEKGYLLPNIAKYAKELAEEHV